VSSKLATVAKQKGSSDNITIIVVLLKPVQELVCPPLVPDQVDGRSDPHTYGITSTSEYVLGAPEGGSSGRSSTEPDGDALPSPTVRFDGEGAGAAFSPAAFDVGNGFDISGEQFNTNLEDVRFSNGGCFSEDERVSGVELFSTGEAARKESEELKRQSIDKVDDLLAMLDREGGRSSPEGAEDDADGGLSLDEVLARAREQGGGELCEEGEEGDSADSSEEEDIVTEFPTGVSGSALEKALDGRFAHYEEGRQQACEQVVVVATGPEECGMVVPPSLELPTQQLPEVRKPVTCVYMCCQVLSVMSCSMVAEEPINGTNEVEEPEEEQEAEEPRVERPAEELVTFEEGDVAGGAAGFMLKTPGRAEQQLASFEPEDRETSVDTGEAVEEAGAASSLHIPALQVGSGRPFLLLVLGLL
jgi:hypothetical protein